MKTEKNTTAVTTRIPYSTWEWLTSIGPAGGVVNAIILEAERAAKNGYPEKSSNWVDIEINDPLFEHGVNPRYELIYQRAADGKFIFEARKIRDGYIRTADDIMKEIGQIGIA